MTSVLDRLRLRIPWYLKMTPGTTCISPGKHVTTILTDPKRWKSSRSDLFILTIFCQQRYQHGIDRKDSYQCRMLVTYYLLTTCFLVLHPSLVLRPLLNCPQRGTVFLSITLTWMVRLYNRTCNHIRKQPPFSFSHPLSLHQILLPFTTLLTLVSILTGKMPTLSSLECKFFQLMSPKNIPFIR